MPSLNILRASTVLYKRDFGDDDHDVNDSWWYSDRAEAIKWGVVGGIFFIVVLWLVGGYFHARRRVKKGLPPLAYHRWLLPRSQRMRFAPQNQFSFYQHHQAPYEMQNYPPPPPAYNDGLPPPTYEPPQGASKADPNQLYPPPPGPPPGHRSAGGSSAINQPSGLPSRQYGAASSHMEEAQLPARPEPSAPSWNPVKRLRGLR